MEDTWMVLHGILKVVTIRLRLREAAWSEDIDHQFWEDITNWGTPPTVLKQQQANPAKHTLQHVLC